MDNVRDPIGADGQSRESRPPRIRWLERLILLALLLAGSLAMAKNHADADLWGHVTFGLNVLASGQLPATASHTFTAEGYRWINHENLSEITLGLVSALGGGAGLLIFKSMLGVLVLGLIVNGAVRQRVDLLFVGVIVALVAINLTANWTLRPQIFTYVYFTVMIALLDAAFTAYHPRGEVRDGYLWGVVFVLFLWANSHGGFVAGYCVFVLYVLCRSAEALMKFGRPALKGVSRLALITFCGGLATLVNPYGPHLHGWLLDALRQPRPEITEWASLAPTNMLFWPFATLLLLAACSLFLTDRRRDVTLIVVLAVTAWQAVTHLRHVPFFAILAGFWIPVHLQPAWRRISARWRRSDEQPDSDVVPSALVLGVGAACICLAMILVQRNRELLVDKREFPVDAVQFMADHGLSGRLVVTFNWAQYALAALGPDTTVGFDGRFRTCYPQEVVDMHFDFVLGDVPGRRWRSPGSPSPDANRVLEFGTPDLALIDPSQAHSVAVISRNPDWVLLYEDPTAQVWGRRSRFDDPAHPDYVAESQRRTVREQPAASVPWPALPERLRGPAHAGLYIDGFPRNRS